MEFNCGIKLENKEVSVRGWNWGKVDVQCKSGLEILSFDAAETRKLIEKPACQSIFFFLPLPLSLSVDTSTATDLSFLVQNKPTFEIPLSTISNSNMAGKNEVSLEFTPSTTSTSTSTKPLDELIEMRFYIPGRSVKPKDTSDDEVEDSEDEGEVDDEGNEISAAQSFHDRIKKVARVGDTAGEEIVAFSEVLVVTPRFVCSLRL